MNFYQGLFKNGGLNRHIKFQGRDLLDDRGLIDHLIWEKFEVVQTILSQLHRIIPLLD